jgi:hypothetical protein
MKKIDEFSMFFFVHDLQTKSMNLHDMNFQNKQTKQLSVQVFI